MEKNRYELKTEDIESLIREAERSGYPVVSLLSDGSIGHYFDKQTREMNNNPHPIITLEKTEVIRYFREGNVSWEDFIIGFSHELYDDVDWNTEEQ